MATSQRDIARTISKLRKDAEAIRNTDPQDLSTMEVGDEFPQGDCRIIRMPDDFARKHAGELRRMTKPQRQLAPGNTQGSRHELSSLDGITMYLFVNATPLDGPVFVADRPFSITHPEHGDAVNLPAGCYAVPGQRAFADELQRAAD